MASRTPYVTGEGRGKGDPPSVPVLLLYAFVWMLRSDTSSSTIDGSRAGCCVVGVKHYKSKMGTVT